MLEAMLLKPNHDHCRQAVCPTAYCGGGCGRDIELFAPVRASCRPRDRIFCRADNLHA